MGERDGQRHIDSRAVRAGLKRAAVVTAGTFAVTFAVRTVVAPVVRDLTGGVSVPGVSTFGLVAAVVGALAGLARMRAARRLGARTDAGLPAGARALDIARRSLSPERTPRAENAGPVQRWSADLLHGGAPVPAEAGVMLEEPSTDLDHLPGCSCRDCAA